MYCELFCFVSIIYIQNNLCGLLLTSSACHWFGSNDMHWLSRTKNCGRTWWRKGDSGEILRGYVVFGLGASYCCILYPYVLVVARFVLLLSLFICCCSSVAVTCRVMLWLWAWSRVVCWGRREWRRGISWMRYVGSMSRKTHMARLVWGGGEGISCWRKHGCCQGVNVQIVPLPIILGISCWGRKHGCCQGIKSAHFILILFWTATHSETLHVVSA